MTEENIASFATLPEQEWRGSVLRLIGRIQEQVDANTEITADTQELLNRDVIVKVADMYAVFEKTRNGFRMIGAIGDGVMKTADAIYKHGRPLFWIFAVTAATITAVKTGEWKFPEWWLK